MQMYLVEGRYRAGGCEARWVTAHSPQEAFELFRAAVEGQYSWVFVFSMPDLTSHPQVHQVNTWCNGQKFELKE